MKRFLLALAFIVFWREWSCRIITDAACEIVEVTRTQEFDTASDARHFVAVKRYADHPDVHQFGFQIRENTEAI